ncbi:hypothetical protein F5Y14DRAFT_451632 [Nemania sp. NC0429]|nr:hypothetical protein F5Y14DRAFT_451632 [Nemania sp. NC0429]
MSTTYTRPMEWSGDVSVAISQWRGLMEDRTHSNNEANRESYEDQLQSDPSTSEANSSETDGSVSSKEKFINPSRDVTAHLKYLVRGFLKQARDTTTATPDTGDVPSGGCFVPSPMVTFLIDQPDDLICQVCRETPLKLAVTAENPTPDLTYILPCGHIFCSCIGLWLESHDSCPFCRTSMTYTGCKHPVKPRVVAQDTIHTLPDTLANGGVIANLCPECDAKDRREISVQRWADHAKRFEIARRGAKELGTKEAMENLKKAQKAFERVPEDDFWVLMRRRQRQW